MNKYTIPKNPNIRAFTHSILSLFFLIICLSNAEAQSSASVEYPVSPVSIQPVLFIPTDQKNSASSRWGLFQRNLQAYLYVTQSKWKSMLGGETTFRYEPTITYYGNKDSAAYNADQASGQWTAQDEYLATLNPPVIFAGDGANVCNHDQIILILVAGGNRFTQGGGGNWCSSATFDGIGSVTIGIDYFYNQKKLSSTLVHEIGHAFGLVHSWQRIKGCEGSDESCATANISAYSKDNGISVMSYNKKFWSNSIHVDKVSGSLLPVELFELSHNRRAIPFLQFKQSLTSDEERYSSIFLQPQKPLTASYDEGSMWQSPNVNTPNWPSNWVSLPIVLPRSMTVDHIVVSTGASGGQLADLVQIEYLNDSGDFVFLKRVASDTSGEAIFTFDPTEAQEWKIALSAKDNINVVLRGVKFSSQGELLYPLHDL